MRYIILILLALIFGCSRSQNQTANLDKKDSTKNKMNYNKLTPEEERVIINKGTERPFTGEYENYFEKGTYICKRCDTPLYTSDSKFHSGCGWPSFDREIPGMVKRVPDADGSRTEIICNTCGAHLGHVFTGEGFTDKNTRHCVNSISLKFVKDTTDMKTGEVKTEKAIFAGGCFWGVEYYFQKANGVKSTEVGYIGGHKDNPTYKEVCSGKTGHIEAIEVEFDPLQTSYEEMAKLFFEIHDFTQTNGQGPDIGEQYLSEIFYFDDAQKETAEKLIKVLTDKGYKVATNLRKATTFWQAEDYHQEYYQKNGHEPYCHARKKVF
ncbi:MAG: bifunctional methionine sulfoxide reductase B/A protein [Ignavibacteriae bacterium]|nr:bifunctional methionine sulfoxide reductase B/A protein [Ignavibacteriota bacterium]